MNLKNIKTINLIIIQVVSLIFTLGCNNNSSNRPVISAPHKNYDPELKSKIKSALTFPEKDDWAQFTFIRKKLSDNKKDYCIYNIDEKDQIADISATVIKLIIDRSILADNHNPVDCPLQIDSVKDHEEKSISRTEYLNVKLNDIMEFASPQTFAESNSTSLKTVVLKNTKELIYKNIPTTLYEYEIETKTGLKYSLVSYISSALILGVYERLLTTEASSQFELNITLKGYSIKRIGKFPQ